MTAVQCMKIELRRVQQAQAGVNKYSAEYRELTQQAREYREGIEYMESNIK